MATKPIDGNDIIKDDALDNHINQLRETLEIYGKIDREISKIAKDSKKMNATLSASRAGDMKLAIQQEKVLSTAIVEQERVKRAKIQTEKALIGLETKRANQRKKEIAQRKNLNNVYKQESKQLTDLINRYQNLAARGRENGKVARGLLKEITRLDTKLKGIDKTVGRNFRNVGNYASAWNNLRTTLLGGLGISTAIIGIKNLGAELLERGNDLRGIEFAFDRLGARGEAAFERVKNATRGLVADTDIKRSLVEFDNFNISLEQTDVLFEFLAVRAAQTGTSIDKLKDSLVEGLSKESKLRIDNLGISASELNAELEQTPDFVQAVANIAKREVAEAGAVLDEAGNNQQRWNVVLQNTKDQLSRFLIPVFDRLFRVLNFVANNFRTISKLLTIGLTAWGSYRLALKLTGDEFEKIKKSGIATFLTNVIKSVRTASLSLKGMAAGFRGIGTAIKSIPLAGWISLLSTGITTILSFTGILGDSTDEIDENTAAIEENNRALERGLELIKQRENNLKGIADTFESLNELSQEQLKVLKSEIETEIAATSEAEKSIKVAENQIDKFNELKDTLGPVAEAKKRVADIQAQLNERDEAGNFIIRSADRDKLRKELAAQENILKSLNQATFQKNKLQKEGVDINADETSRLADLQEKLAQVNALIKEETTGRGSSSKARERAKIELTGLDKLRAEQTKKAKALSDELIISNGLETEKARILREQLGILDLQIARAELVNETGGLEGAPERFRAEARSGAIDTTSEAFEDDDEFQPITELGLPSKKKTDDAVKNFKTSAEIIADISNRITDLLRINFERRLEILNAEEEAEKRKADAAVREQDRIIAARNAGVQNAEDSLAFEKKAEAEALAEQERILKRKQRIQLVSATLEAFNSQVQQGVNNPAGSTIAQLGTLLGFLNSIPAFWTGTETTVGDSLGNKVSNGRDGILARVDKDEIILNKEKSDRLKGLTTDQITNYALMYQNGVHGMERRTITAVPTYSDPKIYDELKQNNALLKQIAGKPVIDNSAEIVGKVLHFIKKETGNGKTTTTIHKTRLR